MIQLSLFRALQGIGGGGLIVLAQSAMADHVSPRERGRYAGLIAAAIGVSSTAGPPSRRVPHGPGGLALHLLRERTDRHRRPGGRHPDPPEGQTHGSLEPGRAGHGPPDTERRGSRAGRRVGRHDVRLGLTGHRRLVRPRCAPLGNMPAARPPPREPGDPPAHVPQPGRPRHRGDLVHGRLGHVLRVELPTTHSPHDGGGATPRSPRCSSSR